MSLTDDENPKVPKKEVENFYLRKSAYTSHLYILIGVLIFCCNENIKLLTTCCTPHYIKS